VKDGYSLRAGLGVLLLSMALMTTELVLTRIFSVIVWYHFAFFAISVALFGSGAAALVVHLAQQRLESRGTGRLLATGALALAASVVLVDLALLHVTPDWFGLGAAFTELTLKLLALFLLTALPFFCGGFALAFAVLRFSRVVHRVYYQDLLGAGLGCLLVVPLLGVLGGPLALLAAAFGAIAAALLFAGSGGERVSRGVALCAAAGGLLLVGLALTNPLTGLFRVRIAKGMPLDKLHPEFNRWNSFSMVTVLPQMGFRGWGLSPAYKGPIAKQKTLVIDMNAMTTLSRFNGSFDSVRYASFDLSAFVYRLDPGAGRVCVIGAGGGKDVLAALSSGAKHATAVEINPLIVDGVMRGKFRNFTGNLYGRKDVSVGVEDGRAFVRGHAGRYDVLQLSMVDTSAATAAGAYALTENSLYTADAFRDFLKSLRPGGMLSVASVSLPGLAVGARLASIARAALVERGGAPSRSVIVLSTPWLSAKQATLYNVIVKPDGFSPAEAERALGIAQKLEFLPVYVPGQAATPHSTEQQWIERILTARDGAALAWAERSWPLDVSATTDDHPFFFYQNRLRDLWHSFGAPEPSHLFGNGLVILSKVVLVSVVLVLLFLLIPFFFGRRALEAGAGAVGWDLAYVACLGFGFMFIEIALMLRFSLYLGHPTLTLSVVLLVLLVASALGSRMLARGGAGQSRRLRWALGALVLYTLLLAAFAGRVIALGPGASGLTRSLVAGALIAPVGFLLGVPFPTGLRAVAERANTRIPWLWSVNSATSVLGSVLATLVALHAGISATLETGAVLYVLVLALSFKVVRPAPLTAT